MDGPTSLHATLALLLLTPALAGCAEEARLDVEDRDVLEDWQASQLPEAERGTPGAFQLEANPLLATGQFQADALASPFELRPAPSFPDGERVLFLGDARLDDGSQGLLVLEGEEIRAEEGSLEDVPLDRVNATEDGVLLGTREQGTDIEDDGWALEPDWSEAESALFFADTTRLEVRDVRLDGFDRGVLVTENDSRSLPAPTTVRAGALAWDGNSTIETDAVEVAVDDLAAAANATSGSVDPDGRETIEDPQAIFGHGGQLRAEPARLASSQPVRLTQVLDDEGDPAWRANIEVHPTADAIRVEPGETAWLPVLYREASGEADALMANATVTGDAKTAITVPVEEPPFLVERLWEEVFDDPAAALLLGLPLAAASPFLVMAEALACLAGCPQDSPYPSWMDAGDVGTFYVKVDGSASPGEYAGTIQIEGQNYDPVTFPLTVTVEPDPEPAPEQS